MGVDETAVVREAGRATSTLLGTPRHLAPPGLPSTHLSRGTAVRATSTRAASAACRTVHAAKGEGRGPGVPRGCDTKRYEC